MPRGIFLIFMAFGLAIAGGSSYYYAMAWSWVLEGRSWPTTQGTIVSISVDDYAMGETGGHSRSSYPWLAYSYRVGNRTLSGNRIWLTGNQFFQHREDADAFVRNYAVGQSVPVLYDPQDPDNAALLVPAPPWQILLLTAVGLAWMALSLGFRLMDPTPEKRRYGHCRKCGARLPFDEYVPAQSGSPPLAEVPAQLAVPAGAAATPPASDAAPAPAPVDRPCPRCGQADPLNCWNNKIGQIGFVAMFVGFLLLCLYLVFG